MVNRLRFSDVARTASRSSGICSWPERASRSGPIRGREAAASPESSGQVDSILAEIVEDLTCRLQAGEAVEVEDYVALYPEWADTLRALFSDLRGLAVLDRSVVAQPPPAHLRHPAALPDRLGDFAIRAELGRGGMGIVYEAEQLSLSRCVALKVLSSAAALDARSLLRFQIEAQAAACLNHEHIVPVYAVGSHDDVPYYAMQYIEGASLAGVIAALRGLRDGQAPPAAPGTVDPAITLALDLLADRFKPGRLDLAARNPLDFRCPPYIRAVVRLVAQAADALDHAHDQEILHRDIKPANLLLDHTGKLWVTDFGLARIIGKSALTATGDLPGTLRYMSPEQARGKRALVDRRSDVYALGATLYELLTLEPAIDGHEHWEILAKIGRDAPPPVHRRNPAVSVDLATIVATAMANDVAARYQTAGELAIDLNRFLDGRTINARPASIWEQGVLWCRRNPAVAALLAAFAVVFLTGFLITLVLWHRANLTARRELGLRVQAQAEVAARDIDRGLELARRGRIDQGLPLMLDAIRRAPDDRPELREIARANLAAWEGQTAILEAIFEHRGAVKKALFNPDGNTVVTGGSDGTAQMWEVATGRALLPPMRHGDQVGCLAFSPDGRLVLTGGADGNLRLWHTATAQPASPPLAHGDAVATVAFSPDGRFFVSLGRDRTARLWQTDARHLVGQPVGPSPGGEIMFSPDSASLVTTRFDGVVSLWNTATAQHSPVTFNHGETVSVATFSPDGRLVATGGIEGTVRLWDAATAHALIGPGQGHGVTVTRASFSPDGKLLLTVSHEGSVLLWDVATGQPKRPSLRHDGEVIEARFSPGGTCILTANSDHTAQLWDVASGRPISSPLRHRLPIHDMAFSPDGTRVVTASADGTAKLWKIATAEIEVTGGWRDGRTDEKDADQPRPRQGIRFGVADFSPDRATVVLGSARAGLARQVDTATGQPVGPPIFHRWSRVRAVLFSPDGRLVATASHKGIFREGEGGNTTCQIWNAATGLPASPLLPHVNFVSALAFRPDGKALATGDHGGTVQLWDVETGSLLGPPLRHGSTVLRLAYSPDGQTLAAGTAGPDSRAVLWNMATGLERGQPIQFQGDVVWLVYSPDGSRLAACSLDATVRLIDVASGRLIGAPIQHPAPLREAAFSPDGRMLLTAYGESNGISSARLWDVATGRPRSPILNHPSPIMERSLAFSPDGAHFVTGCKVGSVHLWHVASARQVGPPRRLRDPVLGLAFSADSRKLLAVDEFGHVHSWPVTEPARQSLDQLIMALQVRTGLELDAAGEIAVLEPDAWRRRRRQIAGPGPQASRGDDLDWHEARARDAEEIGDEHGARWHLDHLVAGRPDDGMVRARRALALVQSGQLEAATADLVRAIDQCPRDRMLNWLTNHVFELRSTGRPAYATCLLDQVVGARPGDGQLGALRSQVLAALARTAEHHAARARAINPGADIPFLTREAQPLVRDRHFPDNPFGD